MLKMHEQSLDAVKSFFTFAQSLHANEMRCYTCGSKERASVSHETSRN